MSEETLERELRGIDAAIQEAAVAEDGGAFLRLTMRKVAIPALLREAKSEPVRREIERLEEEMRALDEELRRARQEPPPEVPAGARDRITPVMARNARLGSISTAASAVGKELAAKRRELAGIVGEDA